jgi:hypothetical protein
MPKKSGRFTGFGVVRLDHAAQRRPGDDLLHGRQEHVALGRSAVLLEPGVLVSGYGEGLLLHARDDACAMPSGDLISVA